MTGQGDRKTFSSHSNRRGREILFFAGLGQPFQRIHQGEKEMTDRSPRVGGGGVHQVRRLEEAVHTLREELSDANEELLASRKLFDEQRCLLLRELDRERLLREQMQREVTRFKSLYESQLVRPATSTVGTSTIPQMEVSVATEQSFPVRSVDMYDEDYNNDEVEEWRIRGGQQQQRPPRLSSSSPSAAYVNNGPQRTSAHQYQPPPPPPRNLALTRFADWLCRSTGYYSADLARLFTEMGATSVMEVCAHVTVDDFVRFGVPVVKARQFMHWIGQQGQRLLYQ